ncbi:MAG: 50S ribosomal protein L22 [Patescibacteria group bacterium]|nr:50S ribosomal protein L22 [Patescibacteria group bacterium]
MTEAVAKLKNIDVAPRKMRKVAGLIRGLTVNEALAQLEMLDLRGTEPLRKLVYSAVANAKNGKLDEAKLYVKELYVDKGLMLKRYLPRAQGRATPLQKKRSHVVLVLAEKSGETKDRFVFHRTGRKIKSSAGTEKKVKEKAKAPVREMEAKPKEEKSGETPSRRRIFRRKAI